jgi:cytochrome c oxidase subunit 3
MASLSSPLTIKPKSGGGGGGVIIRHPGGGDGDNSRRGNNLPDYGESLRRYRLGLAVGMAAVVMLFVSFTSAYIVRQGLGTWDPATNSYTSDWRPVNLPTALLLVNTVVLLASSFTIERARRRAAQQAALAPVTAMPGISAGPEKPVPWLGITLALGFAFLLGQGFAWHLLQRSGFSISTGPSSSFFYVLTGAHALHLAGGVIALLYAAASSLLHRAVETRRIVVDVTAWYWHVMMVLWLYVFALLELAR